MELTTPFGLELRLQRNRRGLLLKDLAEKMDISAAYLSTIETGVKVLTEKFAMQCIDAMEALMDSSFDREKLLIAAYASVHSFDVRSLSAPDRARIGLEIKRLRGEA
ncbi:helix-turn-helix transcriptional regulator (plasmid) [Pseudomonas silesiensis]|uniref:helix-turn-helix domain-containing protein n=1 Tax=Pseudomonas silesiensis TaxID=1853130 RepID=UPI0030D3E9EB